MDDLVARLGPLHTALLCDVLDAAGHRDSFLGTTIRPINPGDRIAGPAFTMRCEPVDRPPEEPYATLLEAFDAIQPGQVVVVQAGDRRSGMWGELLSVAARGRGAVGAVIDGATRDVDEIIEVGFPVFAAGFSPLDSAGRQEVVEFGRPIRCGEADIAPGDLIVGDVMGVIAIPGDRAAAAVADAEAKLADEQDVRAALERGERIGDVFSRYGVL